MSIQLITDVVFSLHSVHALQLTTGSWIRRSFMGLSKSRLRKQVRTASPPLTIVLTPPPDRSLHAPSTPHFLSTPFCQSLTSIEDRTCTSKYVHFTDSFIHLPMHSLGKTDRGRNSSLGLLPFSRLLHSEKSRLHLFRGFCLRDHFLSSK